MTNCETIMLPIMEVEPHQTRDVLRSILHTIVFNRALGCVRPMEMESDLFGISYVSSSAAAASRAGGETGGARQPLGRGPAPPSAPPPLLVVALPSPAQAETARDGTATAGADVRERMGVSWPAPSPEGLRPGPSEGVGTGTDSLQEAQSLPALPSPEWGEHRSASQSFLRPSEYPFPLPSQSGCLPFPLSAFL